MIITGIDEAGRGCLAGPVTAAAVIMKDKVSIKGVRDSKSLSTKQREEVFQQIKDNPAIDWKVSFVWTRVIDRLNIWQATLLAWKRSLKKLNSHPNFVFLDGNYNLSGSRCGRLSLPHKCGRLSLWQYPVIKGDQKIFLLSLASIIAKVSRDRLMERLDKKYPNYGFVSHKGYGTKLHLERLKKFGPSEIHRKSFRPVFNRLSFTDKVYHIVSRIPKGQVMTYQQVAEKVGHPRAFRAVGNALNKNPYSWVPCHRVIRSGIIFL